MYFVQLLLCHESHLRKRPQVMELANIILPQHNPGCHSLLLPNSLTPLAPVSCNSICICGPNNISNTLFRALPSKHHVIWWETIACSSELLTVSQWILSLACSDTMLQLPAGQISPGPHPFPPLLLSPSFWPAGTNDQPRASGQLPTRSAALRPGHLCVGPHPSLVQETLEP